MSFIKSHSLLNNNSRIETLLGSEASKYKELLYKIILGLEEHPHEFYSEVRSLKSNEVAYDALQTYRKALYQDPQLSRMWRAAYTYIHEHKFSTIRAAADFFLVCEHDLESVVNFWNDMGQPSLLDTYLIKHRRILDEQVTPERVNPTQMMWQSLNSAVRVAMNRENLRYLVSQGFVDEETLAHDCLCAGIQHAMTLDFLPEQERIALSRNRINQYIIDQAKFFTAKGRSKNEVYRTEEGVQFQRREFSFEELAADNGSYDRVEAVCSQQPAFVLDDPEYTLLLQKLQNVLSPIEYRLIYNLIVDTDEEIEEMLEGYPIEQWFEWLCNKMGVNFTKLASKMSKALGEKPIACLFQ